MNFFKKLPIPAEIKSSAFECRRDHLTLRGTEYRPEGTDLPIAIVCHGFMAWQDSVKHYALLLAKQGYAAYCFDFSGGSVMKSQSDGKTADMSVLTEVRDLEAVIEYVQALPYTDSNELLLMGCSQGGFVCALAAAKNKYPVRKLSLFYPALCIPDDARAGKMMMARFDPNHVPDIISCGPMRIGRQYVTDMLPIDPFEEIKPYLGDVLIVHGSADRIVSSSYSEKARQAYESTHCGRVQMYIIEGGGHMFSKKHDRIAMSYLTDFCSKA